MKKIATFLFLILLILSLISGCSADAKAVQTGANNINIMSYDGATTDGKHIFFVSSHYRMSEKKTGIYRINMDGSGAKQIVYDPDPRNLILAGNKIYYLSLRVKPDHTGTYPAGFQEDTALCCIDSSGSNPRVIKYFNDTYIDPMYLNGNSIYFLVKSTYHPSTAPEKDFAQSALYRMALNGSGCTKVTDLHIDKFTLSGGYVYAVEESARSPVYKIDLSSGKSQKILEDNYDNGKSVLCVSEDDLYFAEIRPTGGDICIFKLKTDGTGKENLNIKPYSMYNVLGQTFYYAAIGGKIMARTPDGKETVIYEHPDGVKKFCEIGCIAGDWIFTAVCDCTVHGSYISSVDTSTAQYYMVKKDGTEAKQYYPLDDKP